MERLRAVHLRMVDAVSGRRRPRGRGPAGRGETGGVVAIVVPRLGGGGASGPRPSSRALRRYVGERHRDRAPRGPARRGRRGADRSGDEQLGAVLLAGDEEPAPDALEFLHVAAVACLTEVAVEEARRRSSRTCAARSWRSCADATDLDADDVLRRAARLGCDLSRGAVALCAELSSDRPGTSSPRSPGSTRARWPSTWTAAAARARVYALLPRPAGTRAATLPRPQAGRAAAAPRHRRASRRSTATSPTSGARSRRPSWCWTSCAAPTSPIDEDIGTGTYRLLFRVLASHPEEVRSFYEDTVAPMVAVRRAVLDRPGRDARVAYLERNCNMNATASAIYAHRHTALLWRIGWERVKGVGRGCTIPLLCVGDR
jgi:hypothetical protein